MRQSRIQAILQDLEGRCPAGFALAFHVKYTTPDYLFQTYATAWMDIYSQKGFVMLDPTVRWGFENTGHVRWSDLAGLDEAGVLKEAAEHGLAFGICFATDTGGSRSVCSFARGDREFTDAEAAELTALAEELHELTADLGSLSPETAAELRRLSIRFTHPGSVN